MIVIAQGFDTSELDRYTMNLLDMAQNRLPKESKKFLRAQATKLNKENKNQAKIATIGKKTGNFMKGFKKGKVYKFNGDLSIRAFNSSPHAHLLDAGHIIKDKNGVEHGFKEGEHFMKKAQQAFESGYINSLDEFIDSIVDKL